MKRLILWFGISWLGCTAVCGDALVSAGAGEECDDGNAIARDGCDPNCRITGCGNDFIDPSEECDDGNTAPGDGCSALCRLEFCGDGATNNNTEECDDQNLLDTDGCLNSCQLARCGDGILRAGVEQCDDGNLTRGDGCDDDCFPSCGNGVVDLGNGEECDDANNLPSDGCDACVAEVCGDGIPHFALGERCDDGNASEGDGCDSNCTPSACGNDIFAPDEVCLPNPSAQSVFAQSFFEDQRATRVGVRVLDFDGDGLDDIFEHAQKSDFISQPRLLRSTGRATFQPKPDLNLPFNVDVSDFVLADLTGDGRQDVLFVFRSFSAFVPIEPILLVAQADGSFVSTGISSTQLPVTFATRVLLGNVDADPQPELVLADDLDDSLSVYDINAGPSFSNQRRTTLPLVPERLSLADLDGDGVDEILAAAFGGAALHVLRVAGASFVEEVVTLAAPLRDVVGASGSFLVLAATGEVSRFVPATPGFSSVVEVTLPPGTDTLLLEEATGDALLDLLGFPAGGNTLALSVATAGGFAAPVSFSLDKPIHALAVGDFNGDELPDLVAGLQTSLPGLSLLFGTGGGAFARQPSFAAGPGVVDVAAGPLGAPLASFVSLHGPVVRVWEQEGRRVILGDELPLSAAGSRVLAADADQDGEAELFITASAAPSVLVLGRAGGPLEERAVLSLGGRAASLVAADLNGDSDLELIAAIPEAGALELRLGAAGDTFGAPLLLPVEGLDGPRAVAAADLDGDGVLDLVAACGETLQLFFGDGTGDFSAPLVVAASAAREVLALDADLDGVTDLYTIEQDVLTLRRGPDASSAVPLSLGEAPARLAAGALSGGAALDLVLTGQSSTALRVLVSQASGAQVSSVALPGPGAALALVDVDGDGLLDVVSGVDSLVSVLLTEP